MVNFSIFNELSLPLEEYTAQENFGIFFELLRQLKDKDLNQIRMSSEFKNYDILKNVSFGEFIGKQEIDFKHRLLDFINNQVIEIDSPIIKNNDTNVLNVLNETEYLYNNDATNGLACCDIWNTIAISFNSDSQWNKDKIGITKKVIGENSNITEDIVQIKHASKASHLPLHQSFFSELEQEIKQNITRGNLWDKKDDFFPQVIVFCPEIEEQIKTIDKTVFDCAISILRDVESKQKKITHFNHSPESQSVTQDPSLRQHRMFTIDGEQEFIGNHVKSLPNHYRIYFLEKESKVYIGYIGKHLPL
ncbi:hypothetical protein BTHERMOSOX_143 [Bathymodiolus thermophilus thioautotrophic gill symbiont]|uniref:Uncharacterized protein n=1 Tax=Bathymodiolus thermophilus thioautotrophic gill symbiont TaxID=2360 RepID=A0A1J5U7T7_9GAMM|nr:hypothetical protein [Bathymodiolus thermophilus thioautotrophic gill symbiont]OIR24433.1 hypothetical protein BGC33_03565 [Bathymodiolus thermophilus thioautotrophic gill symbiont]CAB5494933.1 hypothetical protein THERMOS_192 [Bathymodiolus thermophilus thioautotrophic gill symbiont]SGZ78225.1 hypothetical protein BTHERMOSOX_143 [Bathymodiolus thermophilus thioautotrophic gill symbiont]